MSDPNNGSRCWFLVMLDYIHLMISYWLLSRPLQAAGDILLEMFSCKMKMTETWLFMLTDVNLYKSHNSKNFAPSLKLPSSHTDTACLCCITSIEKRHADWNICRTQTRRKHRQTGPPPLYHLPTSCLFWITSLSTEIIWCLSVDCWRRFPEIQSCQLELSSNIRTTRWKIILQSPQTKNIIVFYFEKVYDVHT